MNLKSQRFFLKECLEKSLLEVRYRQEGNFRRISPRDFLWMTSSNFQSIQNYQLNKKKNDQIAMGSTLLTVIK